MHAHAMTGRWGGHPHDEPQMGNFDPRAFWLAMSAGHGRGGRRGRHRGPGFGPGFGGPPFGRGGRARRGDVRAALLVLLAEEPRNGYGLMQEIEQRSNGGWRPSPGSVYPALAQLEDEGLIRQTEAGGRRAYELTDEGRTYVTENAEELGTPWEEIAAGENVGELRSLIPGVAAAAMQVARAGSEAQVAEAAKALEETRRKLYRILAEEEPEA
jgi:DNA-binding PadR family transcriptional regulator